MSIVFYIILPILVAAFTAWCYAHMRNQNFLHRSIIYDSSIECLQAYCAAASSLRTWFDSFAVSTLNMLAAVWYKIILRVFMAGKMSRFATIGIEWWAARRLVVLIHGRNSDPTQLALIVNNLLRYETKTTVIYAPTVLQMGNCRLHDAARPIFDEIKRWHGKELVLVGISNGARIARQLEIWAEAESMPVDMVRVVSIVGANRGTPMAKAMRWFLPKDIGDEMVSHCDCVKKLTEDWSWTRTHRNNISRDYWFFAAAHDWIVPDFESTLPPVDHAGADTVTARYSIVEGQSHITMPYFIAREIARIAVAGDQRKQQ